MVKSLLIGLVAVLVLVTGATAASSEQSKNPLRPGNVHRLCVWVEQGGTPDTAWDLKAVKAYTATHKVCIEGKKGKPGKNGKNGKAGAKGAQGNAGAQGAQGSAGAQGAKGDAGAAGANGENGAKGADGQNGANGTNGTDGDDGVDGDPGQPGQPGTPGTNGVSVISANEPEGANCPEGGSKFTAANGITYACNGADGAPGANGDDGADGSGVVTVAGTPAKGDKTFSVLCPLIDPNDPSKGRMFSISGGYNIQGSVTASYRSNGPPVPPAEEPDPLGNHGWTITQTSGSDGTGTVYVYCSA
jgi:Collagen triple helix repeat (20 copies)